MTRRLLLQSAAALTAPARVKESLASVGAIDAHAHIDDTPPPAIWPRDATALVEDMDRCGVRLAVFSHLAAIMAATADELRSAHDRSAVAVRRYPDRLRAYIVFQPHLADASMAEMERILAPDSPFVGLKLHGPVHRYPVTGAAWAHAFRFAHEHRLPVLCHAAAGTDPRNVLKVAGEYPGMKLILAHLFPGAALPADMTQATPNVFFDTCASSIGRGQMGRIIRSAGAGRLLFGSDATYLQMGGQVAKIAFAEAPEESKKQIFGLNARAVFPTLPYATH